MTDKFIEYKPGCFVKLGSIEAIYLRENQMGEITLSSGSLIFCKHEVYVKLIGLLSKISLIDNDNKS